MSKEPLRKPVMACKRGLLYNKEHLIKRLLEKTVPREFRHIAKLSRDTCQVSEASLGSDSAQQGRVLLQCAISQQTLNGIVKFVIGFKCGCLLSKQALQMIDSAEEEKKDQN